VRRSLDAFAARGIDPETFHLENLDRLRPLTGLCSPAQIDRFDGLQSVIADRLSAMPPAEIAATLEGLYRQAYFYNETARTMAVGSSPAQPEAKRRLDLWVAAVDQRAFEDRIFLDRIWGEKRIRVVMALNSPHLDPRDRSDIEETFRAEPGGDVALTRLFNERPLEAFIRQFDWLRTYDGASEKYFEHSFWRSQTEASVVFESHFDRERILRLGRETFPREGIERLMEERGYGPAYRRFLGLSDETLIQNFHETMMAVTPQARPASRRRLVEDLTVMGVVFAQRGLDPMRELERRGIEAMVRNGFSREDAELMHRLQTGAIPYTHDRLDDYRARHGLLEEYRTLYRDMVSEPLEEVFSPSNRVRYGMWGNLILNRSLMKVPIFLADLDRVRREVMDRSWDSIRWAPPDHGFEFRDTSVPQWFTPSDLGLCHSLTGGPLTVAGLATYHGRTADELICGNVELMAFLPDDLEVEHALATAIGVFGVVTVRNSDTVTVGDRTGRAPWTAGALLEVATHEAAHVEWFRENFDHDSQRLPLIALNERAAYATGGGFLSDYAMRGFSLPEESEHLGERLRFVGDVVDAANRTLDVPHDHPARMDADYWELRWDFESPSRFAFRPPDVLMGERQREMLNSIFGPPSETEIRAGWNRLFAMATADLRLTPAERRQMADALAQIESPENDPEAGIYFLQSHPLTRVLNQVQLRIGMPPGSAIDMSSEDWSNYRSNMGRRVVDSLRWSHLTERPRPGPR
jgi:hypothetical protein